MFSLGLRAAHSLPKTPAAASSDDDAVALAVVNCLGALLTTWSQTPLPVHDESLADATRRVGDWAKHATLGVPLPGRPADDPHQGPIAQRDWRALTALTIERRRAEVETARSQLTALQSAVWAAVGSLSILSAEDDAADADVARELARVQALASSGDAAAVMRELPGAVQAMARVIAHRQERARAERKALAARVEQLGRALSVAEQTARTDALTAAGNRLAFDDATERALHLRTLSGEAASVILVDADGLKQLNDLFGHATGDAALQVITKAIFRVCTRASDVVCRIGGDEFAIVLPSTDALATQSLSARLTREIARTNVTLDTGELVPLSASVGWATVRAGETRDDWIARADTMLYEEKRGRTQR
jgi:diguanylate cyclase (GGDEF)-like protein